MELGIDKSANKLRKNVKFKS